MARIRTIKPEFFTSEDIVELTPLSRLFYVSLWCEADREGRLNWKPKTLKYRYLPGDDCEIEKLSQELEESGLIRLYEVDGKEYCEIPTFTAHQVINNREKESEIPPNPHACPTRQHASKSRESGEKAEGKEGKEGKGKDASGDAQDFFEEFWRSWPSDLGEKGNKKRARAQWDKLKPDEGLRDEIRTGLSRQENHKRRARGAGEFAPNFQHVERWIRDRGWENELSGARNGAAEVEQYH